MKPIPLKMLPHSCTLSVYGEADVFGDRNLVSVTSIRNVRIVPKWSVKMNMGRRHFNAGGVLYFDMTNSLPHDAEFLTENHLSVIEFEGCCYTVTMVRKLFDESRVHHLEVHFSE